MSTTCHYPTDVSDEQWEILQPLLPKPTWHPGGPGRKSLELRRMLHGIVSVNKTGCLGAYHARAAPLGAPGAGATARAVRGLCRG
jgi:transposase